ncbi:MAG TPA: hypothetical protein VFQ44_01785 [Streptosporangiaceae bacterium]|nr:hypothetical protein [Streptosporangiaceae bacterium]
MGEPQVYWTVSEIGALFGGITGHAVDRLRRRYGDDRPEAEIAAQPSFPEPDIILGVARPQAGWHPEREPELLAWRSGLPGRGRKAAAEQH